MKTKKIFSSELDSYKVASLPTRPSAPQTYGGGGYSAEKLKAAFDLLPLFVNSRINDLVDDIIALGKDSLAGAMPTGLEDGHTLSDLFSDITNGTLAARLTVGEDSLALTIAKIKAALTSLGAPIEEV